MLSERLLNELNEQIKYEFDASHIYLAMAGYFADENLDGFENFFLVQAEEERTHAMKLYEFVNEMGARVEIKGFDSPKNDYSSPVEAFEAALNHEKFVTGRIYKMMDMALEEKEHATVSFLKWFVDEQVEEEDSMSRILAKLNMVADHGAGLLMLDRELSKRTLD